MKNRKRYGGRRISEALKQQGLAIGRHKVRSLMKEQGLMAIQPKSFVPRTTQSRHTLGYAPTYWQKWGPQKPLTKSMWGRLLFCPLPMGNGST
ncbi:MAG: IS3 family transposase [Flammeovirgaceae bacterium]